MAEGIKLAVNGTLMRGLALNTNLLAVGAEFLCETATTPDYRLWSIDDIHPAMVRVSQGGVAVALEVWQVPPAGLVQVLLQEPPGLSIGKVTLATGETVLGVLGEPVLCEGQREISAFGGWRSYYGSLERESQLQPQRSQPS
ncbi:glutamyl-tRNA amidotransferase [filamentous cyanobacterium CCT1]|nr:glutamyl-tRNA amidotransferase [filamentous cyanobacterium CCT1]PSN75676.1 glutamyl-tRNA amidotransferase [filamentous cyanobacterium CCP4]